MDTCPAATIQRYEPYLQENMLQPHLHISLNIFQSIIPEYAEKPAIINLGLCL